jgi:hypothetical protein
MWATRYEDRLIEWRSLRDEAQHKNLNDALLAVDDWWQHAPLVNHYLHIDDQANWPLPWDLIAENTFCDLAKCLGICYTLLLLKHKDIKSLEIIETQNEFVVAVNNELILNYYPREIVNTDTLEDTRILRRVDALSLNLE